MRRYLFLGSILVGFGASLIAACGGTTIASGSGASSTGAGSGSESTTTSTTTGGAASCPAAEPTADASCAPTGLACTYGTAVRAECRSQWSCQGGKWMSSGQACPMPVGTCPTQESAGAVCSHQGDVCTYGDAICVCSECPGGPCMAPPPKWDCAPPPSTPGCPALLPNNGASCPSNGLMCTYGLPCAGSGMNVVCMSGAWVWNQSFACPV